MTTVRAGARLHVGFQNLSLAHERLYGGIGVAIEEPQVVVTADPADEIRVRFPHERAGGDSDDAGVAQTGELAEQYATLAVEELSVPGAAVEVREQLPRHVGLGSGTQLALAMYAAIARAHGLPVELREAAPALGRGGRSGVGVAGFERGGLIVDGGHPTARFTTDRPERGGWEVPPVIARHELPDDWRFVLATPDVRRGRNGATEDESMRSVIERAAPEVADQVSATLTRQVLPAAATGDRTSFGAGLTEIGRLNGAWYADEQGGVYRPPVGTIIETLRESDVVDGVGQSSWGPTIYGLTDSSRSEEAVRDTRAALERAGIDGKVRITAVDNEGADLSSQ